MNSCERKEDCQWWTWQAFSLRPKDDLSDWRYEGVIYRKNQDPKNKLGLWLWFAPDVVQETDGLYHLYYAFDFMGLMGVAVGEKPTGPFQFLGHVHRGVLFLFGE